MNKIIEIMIFILINKYFVLSLLFCRGFFVRDIVMLIVICFVLFKILSFVVFVFR